MNILLRLSRLLSILPVALFLSCSSNNPFHLLDDFEMQADSMLITIPTKQHTLPFADFQFFQFTRIDATASSVKVNVINLTGNKFDNLDCYLKIFKNNTHSFENLIFNKRFLWQNVLADTPTQDSFTVYLPADYTIINPSLIEVDIISATDNIPFKGLYSGSALLFKDVDTSASAYKVIHANATIQADGQVNILFGGNAEAKRFSGLVQPNGTVSGDIFNIEGGAISSVKPDLSISFFQNAAPALSGQITLDNPSSVENIRKIKLELNKEF